MNISINEAEEGHSFLFTQTFQNVPLPGTLSCISACISCGTVALYGPFYLFIFFADHRATVFKDINLSINNSSKISLLPVIN
jgi:hypothetical protein